MLQQQQAVVKAGCGDAVHEQHQPLKRTPLLIRSSLLCVLCKKHVEKQPRHVKQAV